MPTPQRAILTAALLTTTALVSAAAPATQAVAATQPSATQPAPLEARWSQTLQSLSSDSFKERQDAQKQVDQATWRDLPALRSLAAKVTDAEVKDRLMTRVDALEIEAALNPPPISLDLKDADLAQVAQALTNATGLSWNPWNQGRPQQLFTLHAKEKPFWEVFTALSAQHGLSIQGYNGLQLMINEQSVVRGDIHGALLFYPRSLSRTVDLQTPAPPDTDTPATAPAPAVPSLQFQFGVIGDPRLKLTKDWTPEITDVTDDKGNVLYHQPPQNNGWSTGQNFLQSEQSATWPIPEGLGKKISVKGTMKLSLIVSESTVEIPDMVKQGNTPIDVGDAEIVWQKFEPANGILNFQMTIHAKAPAPNGEQLPVRITLLDSDGNTIVTQSIQGGWGGGLGMNGHANGPFKAIFAYPTRTQDRQVDFQFKDLPIP